MIKKDPGSETEPGAPTKFGNLRLERLKVRRFKREKKDAALKGRRYVKTRNAKLKKEPAGSCAREGHGPSRLRVNKSCPYKRKTAT